MTLSGPTPSALWKQAEMEHPDDEAARGVRYRALMYRHGLIVDAKPGEDRNLPCGWPGVEPAPDRTVPPGEIEDEWEPPARGSEEWREMYRREAAWAKAHRTRHETIRFAEPGETT